MDEELKQIPRETISKFLNVVFHNLQETFTDYKHVETLLRVFAIHEHDTLPGLRYNIKEFKNITREHLMIDFKFAADQRGKTFGKHFKTILEDKELLDVVLQWDLDSIVKLLEEFEKACENKEEYNKCMVKFICTILAEPLNKEMKQSLVFLVNDINWDYASQEQIYYIIDEMDKWNCDARISVRLVKRLCDLQRELEQKVQALEAAKQAVQNPEPEQAQNPPQ